MQSTLRFIISLFAAVLCIGMSASGQDGRLRPGADTTAVNAPVVADSIVSVTDTAKKPGPHQLRISFDISKLVLNIADTRKHAYEAAVDFYWKNELYLVAETGYGTSRVDDSVLRYTANNPFLRIGIDRNMVGRMTDKDWDMVFVGFRYGIAAIRRGTADYTIYDPLWGPVSGSVPAENKFAHWFDVTAGMKLELWQRIYAGWNVRASFLLNGGSFKELPPAFIAGYGRGDKSAIFNFNVYLGYALRW